MTLNYEAQSFCLKNGILIYPIPINKKSWSIEIDYRHKKIPSTETYTEAQLTKKIWELYEYFYNKEMNAK